MVLETIPSHSGIARYATETARSAMCAVKGSTIANAILVTTLSIVITTNRR